MWAVENDTLKYGNVRGTYEKEGEEADMRYIISDIHGCYDSYKALLKKINFSREDELYVLGDVVDRGPEPIRILQDMMRRPNVKLILGNHDFVMYTLLKRLAVEITAENCESYLTQEDIFDYQLWMLDGGQVTAKQFAKLPSGEREDILDYIADASLYEVLEQGEKKYILVHAGIAGFEPGKALEEYDLYAFLEERADYGRRYFPEENTYLVTGHTPTALIPGWNRPEVYRRNGHIALDCACVAGGKLAAYCIETEEVIYVEGNTQK